MARAIRGGWGRPLLAGGLVVAALVAVPSTSAHADWLDAEQRLTVTAGAVESPGVSGDRVVYSERDGLPSAAGTGEFDVRVRDLSDGEDRVLSRTATGPASISGQRVAWPEGGQAGSAGIRVADLRTGGSRLVPVPAASGVALSGARLCYTEAGRVWVFELRTDRALAVSPPGATASGCDLDGDTVVWADDRNGHDLDVYARDLHSGHETRLASGPGDQSAPSVDDGLVAWQDAAAGAGDADIYAYDLADGTLFPVSTAAGPQSSPDVSSRRVVWTDGRYGHGNTEVVALDLASGVETRVTHSDGPSGQASIDGDRIVYVETGAAGSALLQRRVTPPDLTIAVADPADVEPADAQPSLAAADQPVITGRLAGEGEVPVVAATLELEYSRDLRTWLAVGSTTTYGDGSYIATVPATDGPVWLRVRFAGTLDAAPAVSRSVLVGRP